ncbi:MAG: porin family protein [Mesorhizobium sp.]|uniref:outer membrane protein n=1 Tax=unclassified Mesorhizobium TaxID=325217 RepID=UPI000F74C7A1|nr:MULTISPECIES: outer membrane protein [unclassified Mesorhizobium]AZO55678.1 porin family protein [Mesorhizobium sp. M8A.F.Ca.ET.057.01.1.1]RWE31077.1 MAG: porin family protein [Mesorhizobium sp.]RWE39706.1 MAG: porin family protein [Mesorhizobium sp.]TJX80729.1 MAG: porin family protein [Mesorhizobium sp.]
MKSTLVVTTILVGLSSGAYAADAVVTEPVPVASSFDWTGAYIGVNAGGGFGTTTLSPSGGGPGSIDLDASGFLGGVQAGYNWQVGQFVYGVEADFQGADIKGDLSIFGPSLETKIDWFGTLRARIGYTPIDRFMIYGTGGLAYGHEKISAPGLDLSKTKAGWTVGAGAEYAINTNWTFKSEYLYTDLGKATFTPGGGFGVDVKAPFHTVRVGLNYKF